MFKFRLLLFFVGVIALLSLTPPTNSQAYGYGVPAYPQPYGYSYAPPSYPAYGSYGSYSKPSYGSSYENCGYMKVIEVLDQIFCNHIDKRRYSSTIYPYIEVLIDQIEYTKEYVCIPDVYDYLTAAQHELETLQDAVYGEYEDSSLLKYYDEYYDNDFTGTQGTGTQGAGTQGQQPNKQAAQIRRTQTKENLQTSKANSQIFLTQKATMAQSHTSTGSKTHSAHGTKTKDVTEIEVDIKQRAAINLIKAGTSDSTSNTQKEQKTNSDSALLDVVLIENSGSRKRSLKKRLASSLAARAAGQRKTRGVEYTDYTCSLLSYAYCDEEYFDELLYNILQRIWTAWDFLWAALVQTWFFISELDCSTFVDRCALIEASIMYGAIENIYYFLIEIEDYVWRMYLLMELDYGDEYGYRAGGGGDTYIPAPPQYPSIPQYPPPSYSPPKPKPAPAYIPPSSYSMQKTPASLAYPYPFGYPYQTSNPPPPQPYNPPVYRPGRATTAASSVSVPSVLLVG